MLITSGLEKCLTRLKVTQLFLTGTTLYQPHRQLKLIQSLIRQLELITIRMVVSKQHCDTRVVLVDHLIGIRSELVEWTFEWTEQYVLFKLMVEECNVCMVLCYVT